MNRSIKLKMNKEEFVVWAYDQFKKYGIRMPESYSAKEIKEYCPDVPASFVDQHVKERDAKRS
jgi:hypothetical protein